MEVSRIIRMGSWREYVGIDGCVGFVAAAANYNGGRTMVGVKALF